MAGVDSGFGNFVTSVAIFGAASIRGVIVGVQRWGCFLHLLKPARMYWDIVRIVQLLAVRGQQQPSTI